MLNLDERSNFIAAEKSRLKAYKEIEIAQLTLKTSKIINNVFNWGKSQDWKSNLFF